LIGNKDNFQNLCAEKALTARFEGKIGKNRQESWWEAD